MLKNYFPAGHFVKSAFRNITKNKVHSFINMAGLSVGMAVAIIIGLWIWEEFSFDKYHQHYDRIAMVKQTSTNNGEKNTVSNVPYPLAAELRKNYGSDFKYVVLSTYTDDHILSVGEKHLMQTGKYFEPQAPEMLSLKMLKGTRNGLLDPSSILLNASLAKAYFGNTDPIGKTMQIDNAINVKVTGVYEDLPPTSTFAELGFIAPWDLFFANTEWIRTIADPWRPNAFQIYTQLADNADINKVSEKIKDAKLNKVSKELAKKKPTLFLQGMNRWHLYSNFKDGVNTGGRIQYVWLFGIIGVFVLLLACINFMNLSTARSEKRAKEVGIRKAIGSLRTQLIYQFFIESLLVVFLSFLLAILLAQLILPFFNAVADEQMSLPWNNPIFWMTGIVFSLLTGLVAGSYPAFYLSSFKPVKILKGTFKAGRWSALPRKILVVLQFSVSVTMIIGTIIVFRQIQYSKNRPIGYSSNGLVALPMIGSEIHKHFEVVKDELLKSGTIVSLAEAQSPVTSTWSTSSGFDWTGKDPNLSVEFPNIGVTYDYGKTIGWQFKEGRDFSTAFATDSLAMIVNETAAKFMGMQNPVGATIKWFGQPFTIIGVAKDMIIQSPYESVKPTVFYIDREPGSFVFAKLNPTNSASAAIGNIEKVFKKFNPSQPFQYKFTDEEYNTKFGNEERIGRLAGFFAILAIFISCLGLFGMASFMAEQRTKEIGVRKVLGATVFNLWTLLSKDFLILIIISLVISIPAAHYLMHNWLQGYEYRTNLSWWIFASAGIGAVVITLLTVSFQSIKTALMNPVKSLRSE